MVSDQPAAEKAVALFEKLGICKQLAESAAGLGWKAPTSIQEQAVPHLLAGELSALTDYVVFHQALDRLMLKRRPSLQAKMSSV